MEGKKEKEPAREKEIWKGLKGQITSTSKNKGKRRGKGNGLRQGGKKKMIVLFLLYSRII